MSDASSSDSPPDSSISANPSSKQTTPDQSPECPPSSIYSPAFSHPFGAADSNVPQQQIVAMIEDETDHWRDFLEAEYLSRRNREHIIARERQKLVEAVDRAAADQQALQAERDEARGEAAAERARAERHKGSLRDARAETAQLGERLKATEEKYRIAVEEKESIAGELQDKLGQLAEAENECLVNETARRSIFEHLARMENEKGELQQQLEGARDRLVTLEGNLAECTRSRDGYYTELSELRVRFDKEQARREDVEEQLDEQTDELSQVRSELDNESNRTSELRLDLDGARTKLVAMDTLRSEADQLRETNRSLENGAEELRNEHALLEREVHGLREQQMATAAEIGTVRTALRNEQRRSIQLQETATNLQRAHEVLNNEAQQLRDRNGRLEPANASLRRTNSSVGRENDALRARCAALNTQAADLQARIDREDAVRKRIPRRPGMVRYRDSPRQIALCQRGPVTIHQARPMRGLMLRPVAA